MQPLPLVLCHAPPFFTSKLCPDQFNQLGQGVWPCHFIQYHLVLTQGLRVLQALPCPGEADMIPEASIASSMLCSHVARSALTPSSWLSMESVVPLIEAGTARCSMAASANLNTVSTAALSALLNMLSASASLPASSMSPVRPAPP